MLSLYNKKYQIFISSTYTDLIPAREEVTKVILNLYQIPIGMEMFSADNDEQWDVIQTTIKDSDYYLLVLGHRYGSVTKEGISYTEKEFDYAKSLNIPIIAFVRDRNIATKPSERDTDPSKTVKLDELYSKVTNNAMCDFWQTEHELGQKVAIALVKMFTKTPRVGWTKAVTNTIETTEELTKLSRENRELREENEQLKSLNIVEKPNIVVSINDGSTINLNLKQARFYEFTPITSIPDDLQDYVNEHEVDDYNLILEQNGPQIEHYKSAHTQYTNKTNNQTLIKVNVSNEGTVKAHDVYVDITFPSEIAIFEKHDDFTEPKRPIDKPHPLESARIKKRDSSTYLTMGDYGLSYPLLGRVESRMPKLLGSLNQKRFWINKSKNTLTIKLESLLHTRTTTISDDIVIAPLSKGKFNINVSIICNEYRERHNEIIPIIVL